MDFVKFHDILQYSMCIVKAEIPAYYSTESFEHGHVYFVKQPFMNSNKRNFKTILIQVNKFDFYM